MTEDIAGICKQAADYVAKTQPILDEVATKEAEFKAAAIKTAAILANRGVLNYDKVDEFAEKLAEDKTEALRWLEKLAAVSKADSLGGAADTQLAKVASAEQDPWQLLLAPETIKTDSFLNL